MMKKEFIKRLIIGIAGIAATIGLFVLFASSSSSENRVLFYIAVPVGLALFLGFVLFIFRGIKDFFVGAGMGLGIGVMIILVNELPIPYNTIALIAALIILAVANRADKLRNIIMTFLAGKSKWAAKKQEKEAEQAAALIKEDEEFKKSIGLGEKSLLLSGPHSVYQIIRGESCYYINKVGDGLIGVDPELLKTDFTDESRLAGGGKKDFIIRRSDITEVLFKQRYVVYGETIPVSGKIRITAGGGKKSFMVFGLVPPEQVEAFFKGVLNFKVKEEKIPEEPEEVKVNGSLFIRLKIAVTVLNILSVAGLLVFPFTDILYEIRALFWLIVPLITLVLYIAYNGILSLGDQSKSKLSNQRKVYAFIPLFAPAFALVLRSLLIMNLIEYQTLIILSIALAAVLLIIFLACTNEYKKYKSAIVVFAVFLLLYAPGAVMEVNHTFDISQPHSYQSTVTKKETSEYLRYLYAGLENGKEKSFAVSKGMYESTNEGDQVVIVEYDGLLGIRYAMMFLTDK